MRRHCTFACEGAMLLGTLDGAAGSTGLLIVSGGNEVRAGPWNAQALLAARIAALGYPVFRFDRRGVGDSEGENRGFQGSAADIAAALTAFREQAPQLTRIVGFGNCDGAAALMLAEGAGCDALVLANPWTIESEAEGPPPAAIRAHYWRRLRDPAAVLRLLAGKVSPLKLVRSLAGAARMDRPRNTGLAGAIATGLARFGGRAAIVLAGRDRTAQVFLARWDRSDPRLRHCAGADHSFSDPASFAWLEAQIREALEAPAA